MNELSSCGCGVCSSRHTAVFPDDYSFTQFSHSLRKKIEKKFTSFLNPVANGTNDDDCEQNDKIVVEQCRRRWRRLL